MLVVQVSPRKKIYVSVEPDNGNNKGGYFCQMYWDEQKEFFIDSFTISRFDIPNGLTEKEKYNKAMVLANWKAKAKYENG